MRINQFISHNSDFSRREADELIKQGLVKISSKIDSKTSLKMGAKSTENSKTNAKIGSKSAKNSQNGAEKSQKTSLRIAQLTDTVGENDKVFVRGKRFARRTKFTLIAYHKPKGELVSRRDERGRRLIYDSLPREFAAWRSVGRLDFASSGLLLLSDSPVIASALMNSDLEREYYLKIKGKITPQICEAMRTGLEIQGLKGAHAKSKLDKMSIAPFLDYEIFGESGGYTKLRVLLGEGQNRELRRFFAHFDLKVMDLKRVAFGAVELGTLKEGKFRYFTKSEYEKVRDFLKIRGVRY